MPRHVCHCPRSRPIDSLVLSMYLCRRQARASRSPAGGRSPICRSRYGVHVATSSGAGTRLSGGRHFTMLAMNTCSRSQPHAGDHLVEQFARPADERPAGQIFVLARAFADEKDFRVGIAFAKDRVASASRTAGIACSRSLRLRPSRQTCDLLVGRQQRRGERLDRRQRCRPRRRLRLGSQRRCGTAGWLAIGTGRVASRRGRRGCMAAVRRLAIRSAPSARVGTTRTARSQPNRTARCASQTSHRAMTVSHDRASTRHLVASRDAYNVHDSHESLHSNFLAR